MVKTAYKPADYILPLYMNGLAGRMLRLPPPKGKKREILYIYGHHSSLERWFGVAEFLNQYGGVTVPDLPGFGGMEPFYKIGEQPSLDNMADYLASFIKLRYKNRRISVAGLSVGFMIVTRMLQKYPEIASQVDILVSQVGFTHKNDFRFSRPTFWMFRLASSLFALRLPAAFIKYLIFRKLWIRLGYKILEPIFIKGEHSKMRDASQEEYRRRVEFEIQLWQSNDVRTYMSTAKIMFVLDLTSAHVDLPVHHISIDVDRYFNNVKVEEHMRLIYRDFNLIKSQAPSHAPSILATAEEAAAYVPPQLRRLLSKNSSRA